MLAELESLMLSSQMVGMLLLSRAVADVGPALADEILEEGRQHLLDAVDTQPGIQRGQETSAITNGTISRACRCQVSIQPRREES